jgi:hypothetical protein
MNETLSGFVMVSLGRAPQPTDRFEWHSELRGHGYGWTAADKVLVTTLPQRASTPEEGNGGSGVRLMDLYFVRFLLSS